MYQLLSLLKNSSFVSGGGRGGDNDGEVRGRSRSARRDDPRRHTLGGDQQYSLMSGQGGPLSRTMDLEVNIALTISKKTVKLQVLSVIQTGHSKCNYKRDYR